MTILHIITRLILGGAQQNTILTCQAQVQAGHRVVLLYGPIYGPEGSLLEMAKTSGATLMEVPAMRRALLPGHDWFCYRALRKIIRDLRPDVVHTHSSKAGIVGRAAAWAEHVPAVIHTVHGLPFHERNPAFLNRLYVLSERWAARRCHHLIGVTQAMIDAFAEHRISQRSMSTMIPSGMDVSSFEVSPETRRKTRRELGIADDAPVLGIAARLDEFKGQADLVEILPKLLENKPKLKLLLVGDGWYRPRIEKLIDEKNVRSSVIMTGLVPPNRIPSLISAMDVHALPSYQEGQPRTMVQALLAGVAIVGYDAGGIGEICMDQETGLLVPVGDKQALAQAIERLLDDPALRQRLVARGKPYAQKRFDHRQMVQQINQVYDRVLASSKR